VETRRIAVYTRAVFGLAEQHAALRRLAALVATGATPPDVCAAVAREIGEAVGAAWAQVRRREADGTTTVVAAWGDVDGEPEATAPIVVDREPWGFIAVRGASEEGLAELTELIAATIASSLVREQLVRIADEQAALRRVAELVARGAPPSDVFATVAEEVGRLLRVASTGLARFGGDETVTVVAAWGLVSGILSVGSRLPLDGMNVLSEIARTGRRARVDYSAGVSGVIAEHARGLGIRVAIGSPIAVGGRIWGAMIASSIEGEPLPSDAELRLDKFSELVATAIANADAGAVVQRLAEEQATLRRVATLVAEGGAPAEVFDAVVLEVAKLSGAAYVSLQRAEGPAEVLILSHLGDEPGIVHPGMRLKLDGDGAIARVLQTGRSARFEPHSDWSGTVAEIARRSHTSVAIGAPIVVEGRLWGVLVASWRLGGDPEPPDAEQRLAEFAELVATAIANADSRDQLAASRARVLNAGDEARRRVVRDLHDGAQQRLVHAVVALKLAQRDVAVDTERAAALLAEALTHTQDGISELRELAHGILPSVLTRGGLAAAVHSVVARLDLPVDVEVAPERLPPGIEASAYFIVAEALTNVAKHSAATRATVRATVEAETLTVEVRDNGSGGADPSGHGLIGLADRAAAHGGLLQIESPADGGTLVAATIPLHATGLQAT
jgi:signal transduction histidine kinase